MSRRHLASAVPTVQETANGQRQMNETNEIIFIEFHILLTKCTEESRSTHIEWWPPFYNH